MTKQSTGEILKKTSKTLKQYTMAKKKNQLDLTEVNGNAFALMAAFQSQAKREGWDKDEIKTVLDECRKGDYDHLLQTLISVCD